MATEARALNYLLGLVIRCFISMCVAAAFPPETPVPSLLVALWIVFLLWPWRGPQVV